jgi:hypothetical protein
MEKNLSEGKRIQFALTSSQKYMSYDITHSNIMDKLLES